MDNKAQISVEYLILIAVGLVFAAIVVLLIGNLFSIRDSVKSNIELYRTRMLQVV
jgi:uncharacterized protein (UPF0333 family)